MPSPSIRVYSELRRHLPSGWQDGAVALLTGATVADLLAHLGIPAAEVGLVSVDGVIAADDQLLANAKEVRIFPPAGGG